MPEVSAPRRPPDDAKPLVGILLYLVSVGFVGAAIIWVCFGTGFFLLAFPAGDFDRNPPLVYGAAPDSGREAMLVSQETGMPHSAVLAALPGSSPAEPPAMGGSTQVSPPVPPSTEPPTQIAPVLGPAPSQSVSLAAPTQRSAPFATESAGVFSDNAGHASQSRRPAVRQGTARWAAGHGQSVHRHLNATERAAFDQLITQLGAETKSVHQPWLRRWGQPDLFDEHAEIERLEKIYAGADALSRKYDKQRVFVGSSFKAMKGDQARRKTQLLKGESDRKRIGIPYLGDVT